MFDLRFTMSDPRDDFIGAREEIARQIIRPVVKLKILSALDTAEFYNISDIHRLQFFIFKSIQRCAGTLCKSTYENCVLKITI